MTVVDASAILALVQGGPDADAVAEALPGARMSAVSLAEVIAALVDADIDPTDVAKLLTAAGVTVEALLPADAQLAGAMRGLAGGRTLSLGDRCCLALTVRSMPPEVLTASAGWADLGLPIRVRTLR